MEQNKLETQFKEQLNSREIKPSEMAWSKLDTMLTVAEKPKAKFPWLFIAASFVGFLLIGTVYFSQKGNAIENQKNEVVIQNSGMEKNNEEPLNSPNPNTERTEDAVVQNNLAKADKKPVVKSTSILSNFNSNQNQIAEVSISNQKTEQKLIKQQTNTVSVDELLAAVESPSKKENQSSQKSVVHVNASNLLSQVDGELELSFREKVITKVSKNYQSVKVALANRNLE
jgi:hypothetical protein